MLRPVQLDASLIGQALPWDLFTESGVLVAGAGLVVADEAQFRKLTARPLYLRSQSEPHTSHPMERLDALAKQAEQVLTEPDQNLAASVTGLAHALLAVYRNDADACLGYPRLVRLARPSISHSLHVLFVAHALAQHLEFSAGQHASLAAAALSMNLSDLALHDRLNDQASTPSAAEMNSLFAHPTNGAALLSQHGVDDPVWLDAVRQHHENLDGSGYPAALRGDQISLAARILRVADYYCAKIAGRYYRPPKSPRFALQELFGRQRCHLDSQISNLLLRHMGLFPPGTLVRLANREFACVTRRGRNGQARFAISFMDARRRPLDLPRERNIDTRAYAVRGFLDLDPAWPKMAWQRLWGY